jgi:hypothetical protein
MVVTSLPASLSVSRLLSVVTLVPRLDAQCDYGTGVQIHDLLGLIRQVRPAILHLREPRFRIMRVHPIQIGQRFLPLLVKPLPLLGRGLLHARGLHQLRPMLVVVVAVVASHDAP